MRIRTDSSASSASLADYVRRCGCTVAVIDRLVIEATGRPESFAAPHADIELEGYLRVWQTMHPQALVQRGHGGHSQPPSAITHHRSQPSHGQQSLTQRRRARAVPRCLCPPPYHADV
jgi:hypothetical protein